MKHILEQKDLTKDKKVERVVFNEITKKAVTNGINNPRDINIELVNAYLARRALDYLVGFNISNLWTKLPGSKSAGRVQSVALKIIAEREHEVELFKPEEYWTIKCIFQNDRNEQINAKLNLLDGKKIEKFSFKNKNESDRAKSKLENLVFSIKNIESKPYKKKSLRTISNIHLATGCF